jgi:aminoglycoside phosphotransferase (APT) family kinase protein
LLDWELTRFGDPIHDLAWAEWIVRFHHPGLTNELDALFDGYGQRPTWQRRHDAMVRACERMLAFVRDWDGNAAAVATWEERIRRTEAFSD